MERILKTMFTLLGRAGFGNVYSAKAIETRLEVVIKIIDKKSMKAAGMQTRVKQEVKYDLV